MKKLFSLLLALSVMLTAVSCGAEKRNEITTAPNHTELSPRINSSTVIDAENLKAEKPQLIFKGKEGGNTLTGLTALEKISFTAEENTKGLSEKKLSHSHGPSTGGEPHYTVVEFQEIFQKYGGFTLDTISEEDFKDEWRVFQANANRSSAMNEYYKLDSKGEKEFAEKLENNQNVLLFTKLKKGGFVIDTPYGNYSPDWAIVCRKDSLSSSELGIYFIVETKAGKQDINLQEVERNKIQCGKLHFQAVSEQIRFDWVNSYEDFRVKFGVAESE